MLQQKNTSYLKPLQTNTISELQLFIQILYDRPALPVFRHYGCSAGYFHKFLSFNFCNVKATAETSIRAEQKEDTVCQGKRDHTCLPILTFIIKGTM